MGWALVTSSTRRADGGLEGEAARLIAQLESVTRYVHDRYGFQPVWRSRDADAHRWKDTAAVAEIIEQGLMRDESADPQPWPELGMTGSVFAYHPETDEGVADCRWQIGGDGPIGFHTSYTFEPGHVPFPDNGPIEPLQRLLCEAATAIEAEDARITMTGLQRALRRARREAAGRLGALMLIPDSRVFEQWPDGVAAYPCIEGYPDGVILAVDLSKLDTPSDLVPALLELDDLLERTEQDV